MVLSIPVAEKHMLQLSNMKQVADTMQNINTVPLAFAGGFCLWQV
jgi:hypothetical protein